MNMFPGFHLKTVGHIYRGAYNDPGFCASFICDGFGPHQSFSRGGSGFMILMWVCNNKGSVATNLTAARTPWIAWIESNSGMFQT